MFTQSSDHDERGISPVIGVILMVAITVLLAATTAVFVLGFGDQTSATPQAGFSFDYDASSSGDSLDITHSAGDTLNSANIHIIVSGSSTTSANGDYGFWELSDGMTSGDDISASEKAVVSASEISGVSSLDLSGATVRVVWQDPEADNSAQLAEWTN